MDGGIAALAETIFAAAEHPLATNKLSRGKGGKWHVRCSHSVMAPLASDRWLSDSLVIGVAPRGQIRRGFLYYIERERAHPSRMNMHYNTWYDLGAGSSFNESAALAVVDAFATEFVSKRGVRLDNFLIDDGWDGQ